MRTLVSLAALLFACHASASPVPASDVAPRGELRVAIGVGPSASAFWATRDASGARGVTVDLASAAAAKLGVPLRLVEYRNAGEITAAASKDAWDLTFMPHEAEREKVMDHGPAYVSYDSTYIVRAGSDIRSATELDRAGIRVGAIEGTSTSRTVARSLKHATLASFAKADDAVGQLAQGRVDALAMGREALVDIAKKVPGTRVLDDVIQSTNVVVVVPKDRPAARAWAAGFLEEAKADGTVRRALDGAGFATAQVAPLAAKEPAPYVPSVGQEGKDVVWVPSPQPLVEKMLDMAKATPADYVMDLGSGDGRMVIAAARRGIRALGVEYDGNLVALSRRNAAQAGVAARAEFVEADLFKTDFSRATVITMFLLPDLNLKLRPQILALKPGTRVVSNSFDMGEWEADETFILDPNSGCDTYCTARLWIVPAKAAGIHKTAHGELKLEQTFQMLSGSFRTGDKLVPVRGRVVGDDVILNAGGQEYRGRIDGKQLSLN